ncbi:MAG: hypothetical protein FWF83_06665 [Clostridiales bacterium]|nr:hypothetical protein [Clostridiales bacterium]
MSFEVIKQIDEIEQKALQIVADAQAGARDLINQANTDAGQLYSDANAKAQADAAAALKQAQDDRSRVFEEHAADTQASCVKLEEVAKSNMQKAASLIMQKVVSG